MDIITFFNGLDDERKAVFAREMSGIAKHMRNQRNMIGILSVGLAVTAALLIKSNIENKKNKNTKKDEGESV